VLLSSVREIKSRIAMDPEWIRSRGEGETHMAVGAAIGDKPDAYRVAVRAPDPGSVDETLLERIRAEAKEEVDLQYTGPLRVKRVDQAVPAKRLEIGASIGHYTCSAGTIGFFARRNADRVLGLVSNNHVLAAQDCGQENDEILHPAPADLGSSPNDVVGYLAGDYPRLHDQNQTVDCAFARLAPRTSCDAMALSAKERLRNTIATAEKELQVEKIGRTTGRTAGRITAIDLDFFDVQYSFGYVPFFDQIEIEAVSETPFCRPGDSGSLVFTRDYEPLGLLFLGTRAGGAFNCGRGYANPIANVLRSLGVTFAS
jgi:hypothetical protein